MNIFWILYLIITALYYLVLILYALPLRVGMITKLSNMIQKQKFLLLVMCGVSIAMFVQNMISMKRAEEKYRAEKERDTNQFFFEAAALFRTQRNVYIIALGFIGSFTLFIVSSRVLQIAKENNKLKERIQNLHRE